MHACHIILVPTEICSLCRVLCWFCCSICLCLVGSSRKAKKKNTIAPSIVTPTYTKVRDSPRKGDSSDSIIRPESWQRHAWDFLGLVLTTYISFSIPFRCVFHLRCTVCVRQASHKSKESRQRSFVTAHDLFRSQIGTSVSIRRASLCSWKAFVLWPVLLSVKPLTGVRHINKSEKRANKRANTRVEAVWNPVVLTSA